MFTNTKVKKFCVQNIINSFLIHCLLLFSNLKFLDTASGLLSSLTDTQGGYCNQGMKLKMYVCDGSSDPNCLEGNNGTS